MWKKAGNVGVVEMEQKVVMVAQKVVMVALAAWEEVRCLCN